MDDAEGRLRLSFKIVAGVEEVATVLDGGTICVVDTLVWLAGQRCTSSGLGLVEIWTEICCVGGSVEFVCRKAVNRVRAEDTRNRRCASVLCYAVTF